MDRVASKRSQVPAREHIFAMMDANPRIGNRGDGGEERDSKVVGAYGRDELNGNGERLQTFAGEHKLALLNTFFETPKIGISHTFQSLNAGKDRYCLGYILTRQGDPRLVRNIPVRPPRLEKPQSDHNLDGNGNPQTQTRKPTKVDG